MMDDEETAAIEQLLQRTQASFLEMIARFEKIESTQ